MSELTNELLWLLPIAIWDTIWKGIALWKAARKDRTNWFIALLVLNTAGILPIVYIFLIDKMVQKPKDQESTDENI